MVELGALRLTWRAEESFNMICGWVVVLVIIPSDAMRSLSPIELPLWVWNMIASPETFEFKYSPSVVPLTSNSVPWIP